MKSKDTLTFLTKYPLLSKIKIIFTKPLQHNSPLRNLILFYLTKLNKAIYYLKSLLYPFSITSSSLSNSLKLDFSLNLFSCSNLNYYLYQKFTYLLSITYLILLYYFHFILRLILISLHFLFLPFKNQIKFFFY